MAEQAERAPRKPYVTAGMKREVWIEKIQDRYNREPTANELLALDNLPCASHTQLFDRSRFGHIIYQRLRHFEMHNNVSILEETGRLLRAQMAYAWTPATSVNGDHSSMVGVLTPTTSVVGAQSSNANMWTPTTSVSANQSSHPNMWTPATSVAGDQSSMPDLPAEQPFNEPLRQENEPVQAGTPNICSSNDMPFRPSPTSLPIQNAFQPVGPVPAVGARIIHGDVYYMPITLTFNSEVSNSSIAIHVPGRPTATYPELLMKGAQSETAQRPSASAVGRGFAGDSIAGGV